MIWFRKLFLLFSEPVMKQFFTGSNNMPQDVKALLLRLSRLGTSFSMDSVCLIESPGGIGRFRFYKQISYLQLRGYIVPVHTLEPNSYSLTPLAWEYVD